MDASEQVVNYLIKDPGTDHETWEDQRDETRVARFLAWEDAKHRQRDARDAVRAAHIDLIAAERAVREARDAYLQTLDHEPDAG